MPRSRHRGGRRQPRPLEADGRSRAQGASGRRARLRARPARRSWWRSRSRGPRGTRRRGPDARGPPAPGPPEGDDSTPVGAGQHPRWEHEFSFPATTAATPGRAPQDRGLRGGRGSGRGEPVRAQRRGRRGSRQRRRPRLAARRGRRRPRALLLLRGRGGRRGGRRGRRHGRHADCAPPAVATSGRGIHFMRALADAVHCTCGPLGTRVLLVKERSCGVTGRAGAGPLRRDVRSAGRRRETGSSVSERGASGLTRRAGDAGPDTARPAAGPACSSRRSCSWRSPSWSRSPAGTSTAVSEDEFPGTGSGSPPSSASCAGMAAGYGRRAQRAKAPRCGSQ